MSSKSKKKRNLSRKIKKSKATSFTLTLDSIEPFSDPEFSSPQDLYWFTKKAYQFLKQPHMVRLSRMNSYDGYIYTDIYPTILRINPKSSILSTFVHELLHYLYPQKSESWVLKMESKVMANLSIRQCKNLMVKLINNI